ncbi:MAG: FAD-binding protein, partial [Candidatus Saccharibacteria bacterium]
KELRELYDIAIIGAGPSGSTLARLLNKQYKVLIIDKRDMNNTNPTSTITKCCGGLLAPDAQEMMARLGLGIPKDILVDPQLFAVRTIDLDNGLERFYQRFYFNFDREKFDKWLVSLIPAHVEQKYSCHVKSIIPIGSGYSIKYIRSGREEAVSARLLVGADGASSMVRRLFFPYAYIPRYIAIQEWFQAEKSMPYFTAVFDQNITDYYSWIIPKENFLLIGSALEPGGKSVKKFEIFKQKLRNYGFVFEHLIKREGAFIARPTSVCNLQLGNKEIALAGEAAGAISPSSAEGMSYCLKSALFLAKSLEPGIEGYLPRYEALMRRLKFNIILKNLKSPGMYNRSLRNVVMHSGIMSMDAQY